MNKNNKHIKTGFTTPDDYFNHFEEKVLKQLSIKENETTLPLETGFTTPNDYFTNLEEKLFHKISTEEDIQKETGFKAPDNYFDNLDNEILNKVTVTETKVIKLFSKKQYLYVASIAAVLILSFFILNPINSNSLTFDDIEYAAFEEYLNTENIDISALELADLYEVDSNELDNISFLSIDDENILDYLSDETTSDDYYDSEL